jgi:hypothetical protein
LNGEGPGGREGRSVEVIDGILDLAFHFFPDWHLQFTLDITLPNYFPDGK